MKVKCAVLFSLHKTLEPVAAGEVEPVGIVPKDALHQALLRLYATAAALGSVANVLHALADQANVAVFLPSRRPSRRPCPRPCPPRSAPRREPAAAQPTPSALSPLKHLAC